MNKHRKCSQVWRQQCCKHTSKTQLLYDKHLRLTACYCMWCICRRTARFYSPTRTALPSTLSFWASRLNMHRKDVVCLHERKQLIIAPQCATKNGVGVKNTFSWQIRACESAPVGTASAAFAMCCTQLIPHATGDVARNFCTVAHLPSAHTHRRNWKKYSYILPHPLCSASSFLQAWCDKYTTYSPLKWYWRRSSREAYL